jgi:hypothetical protein
LCNCSEQVEALGATFGFVSTQGGTAGWMLVDICKKMLI